MNINNNGLPIHADANARIRPRLFVEGNFYVDLYPGHAERARSCRRATTLAAGQNAGPVQLDRVLASLTTPARTNLQTLLQGIGASLDTRGTPAANATQDPSVRGLTGGQALNESLKYSVGAFRASAIVNQALLGQQPHDLSGVVQGNEEVFQGFAAERQRAVEPRAHVQRDDGDARLAPAGPQPDDLAAAAASAAHRSGRHGA